MKREYQSGKKYELNKEIEYNFDKVFSILKDLGVDVPEYVFYSHSSQKNCEDID